MGSNDSQRWGQTEPTLLAGVIEEAGTGIAAYDGDGRIQYANERYAAMLDVDRVELEGRHITETNPEFDRDRFEEYWNSFDDGETRRTETHHRTLDGDRIFPVHVETTDTCIDGQAFHVGTVTDISDRRGSERELRLFRKAVEEAGHAVIITDADGQIEYVNPAFEHDTGYSSEEVLSETPRILKSGKHDDEFYEELWETILAGDVWEAELINRRKSGKLYHCKHAIAPITNDEGTITHFVGVQSDITEQKLREKRLSELTRILRHNLRNTLSAINGFAGVLQEELEDDDHRTQLGRILDQTDALAETSEKVNEVRQLIDIDAETIATCDLDSLLAGLEPKFRGEYPAASITVEAEPAVVDVDPDTCETVIEELVDNAITHKDQETPRATITVDIPEDSTDHVMVRVADNGPGMPTQERAAVQVGTEEPLMHSSGIGLSHVHWVVTDYGGDIRIADNDPRGTVVTLSLPAAQNSPEDG